MNEIKKLRPFQRFCMTIGILPSSYIESMSYEETLYWLCSYLEKTVIPTINNNSNVVLELQEYIKNYFNNLDVQEEINNKLDDMAESGELTEIIAQYLQLAGVLAYNTLADLVAAENIVEGSICRTLGNLTYLDGKGAFYKIRTITSGDVVDGINIIALDISNTLIAELIPDYYIENLQEQITELDERITELKTEKVLIIGDSFIAQYPTNNWGLKLVNLMGLSSTDYTILGEGGAGIYNVGNQNTNFLGLLQANINNIQNKDKYTKIIIGGGYNDGNCTSIDTMLEYIEELVTYCKQQFPNAKIYLSCFGFNMAYDNQLFKGRINHIIIPAYKQASKFGAYYLENTEFCYRDARLYEGTDPSTDSMVHPNDDGQREIAQAIFNALTCGYVPRYKSSNLPFDASTSSDVTSANMYFFHLQTPFNNIVNLNGSFNLTQFTYDGTAGKTIDLGLMPDPLLRKCNSNVGYLGKARGRLYATNSKAYMVDVLLNYNTNGHVTASIPIGSVSESITVTSIAIVDTVYFDRYEW